jgi:hypothetical protein
MLGGGGKREGGGINVSRTMKCWAWWERPRHFSTVLRVPFPEQLRCIARRLRDRTDRTVIGPCRIWVRRMTVVALAQGGQGTALSFVIENACQGGAVRATHAGNP